MRNLIVFILLAVSLCFGQTYTQPIEELFWHREPLVWADSVHADTSYMFIVQFPSRRGLNLSANLDRITNTNQIPALWDTAADARFNGYLAGDFTFTGTGALDSTQIKFFVIDKYGYVSVNDYAYATTGTPPSFSTTLAYNSFTTTVRKNYDLSGAFGLGAFGVLVQLTFTNETATDVAHLKFRFYNN